MTRYLLNYQGSTKGDFICNLINTNDISFEHPEVNKSSSLTSVFKEGYVDLEKSRLILEETKDIKIFPAHRAHLIPREFLDAYKIQIINLDFPIKYFRTIQIEKLIKNYNDTGMLKYYMNNFLKGYTDIEKKIKYPRIDCWLLQQGLELNDKNRYLRIVEQLELYKNNIMPFLLSVIRLHKANLDPKDRKLDYERIFIKHDFDDIHDLIQIDDQTFIDKINMTWLPDVVNIFGYDIDLRSFGYRQFKAQE